MNFSVRLWLKELIFYSSPTIRYAITVLILSLTCILWYFSCYTPCASYIKAHKSTIEQQKRKKSTLEKRLAYAAKARGDLALMERNVRDARALLPPTWQSPAITLRQLFEKNQLTVVSLKQISRKQMDRYRIRIVQYSCEFHGMFEHIVQLFSDLAAAVPAPYTENLLIKRTDKGLFCSCTFLCLEMGDA